MANIEGSIFQGQIGSAHKELGSNALVLEILERKGTTITIYGAEHASAGSDDLQVIGNIVSYLMQEDAGAGGANRYGTISSSTTTNDTLTLTSTSNVVYKIWVLGYPGTA